MEWFLKILLSVLIDKCYGWASEIFLSASLKRGIKIRAEKNLEHVAEGDAALSNGDVQAYLDALNKEQ